MPPGVRATDAELEAVLQELLAIRADLLAAGEAARPRLEAVHANYRDSAQNLLHYLALRRHDLRPLQLRLAALGLSSLGRAESHVLATVEAVLELLRRLLGRDLPLPAEPPALDFAAGRRLLAQHTTCLLGPARPGREVRIMVTMPSEAADDDGALIHDLLSAGMDCLRINCAHDDAERWGRMIGHLRRAERDLGRSCQVMMDLAGPKLRTGPLQPGPRVVRVKPGRDPLGRVIEPARLWLTSASDPQPPPAAAAACLPLPDPWLAQLHPGDRLSCRDARDAQRHFQVLEIGDGGCWAEARQTTYLVPGMVLRRDRSGRRAADCGEPLEARLGPLPAQEDRLLLRHGDGLLLTRDLNPGRPARHDRPEQPRELARIGCSLPEVFDDVGAGEAIWFDDGRIGGVVERVEASQVLVRITQAPPRGAWLRADRGINLPESALRLPALTKADLEDLAFVARHADVVQLSFANSRDDVAQLRRELERLGSRQPAIVLKIETRRGFDNLPDMLLTAMAAPCCGVMIARGDLAVECGFERLAEAQEEILWICEAAHVPVIWATQVLETLAKRGLPSRAEISDAAMGHRAECVMLNKGPYMLDAVKLLDDILRRMQAHQAKKRAMLRELRLAHALGDQDGTAGAVAETHGPANSDH